MTITLSPEAAARLMRMAEEESVPAVDMVEALIAAEHAKREVRRAVHKE